jgi:prepilin-type N-terminal cleavage/methylation domain-containing protein
MNHLITKIRPDRQNGYTMIEIIVGLAIGGLLASGITVFSLQTVTVIRDSKDHVQAMMQVGNAGYWICRDIQMSSNLTLGENAGFPLQLMRQDTDLNDYEVTYSFNGDSMVRTQVKNEGSPVQTLIAQDINTETSLTNLSDAGGLLIFNVTSTSGAVDISRTYKAKPRLDFD